MVEDGVSLSWDAPVEDADTVTGYAIERAVGEGEFAVLVSDTGGAGTSHTDATATEPGETYAYRVSALRSGEQSQQSNRAAGGQVPHDPADLAPSGLTAGAVEEGVSLSWDAPVEDADTVTGYVIERAVGSGEFAALVSDTGGTGTSHTDATATTAGETYAYRVRALRDGEQSQWSDRAEVQVPHDPADLAPSGLTAGAVEEGVSLSWETPVEDADTVTGYAIERAVGSGEFAALVSDTGGTGTSHTDATATQKGETYAYRVSALRDGKQSQWSDRAEVQVPHDPADLAPANLTAEVVDSGVSLSWDAPAEESAPVTGYAIDRAVGSGEFAALVSDTGGTGTSHTDATATTAGETYAYRVAALRASERSSWSDEAPVTLGAAPPAEPEVEPPSGELLWSAQLTAQQSAFGTIGYNANSNVGSLSSTELTLGGESFSVLRFDYRPGLSRLTMLLTAGDEAVDRQLAGTDFPAQEVQYVVLAGGLEISLSDARIKHVQWDAPDGGYLGSVLLHWSIDGLDWSAGEVVELALVRRGPGTGSPTAPGSLTAEITDGGVALSWQAPARDAGTVTGYAIERAVGEGEFAPLVSDTGGTGTSHTDATATTAGETYAYRVAALRSGGQSQWSDRAEVRVSHEPADLAPSGLTAEWVWSEDYRVTGVALSWEPPAEDSPAVTGYSVRRAVDDGETSVLAANTGTTGTSYADTASIDPQRAYSYQVLAWRDGSLSQPSEGVTLQPALPGRGGPYSTRICNRSVDCRCGRRRERPRAGR